jgi:hypothetical protein
MHGPTHENIPLLYVLLKKWNNLPEDVKASPNGEIFRRKQKKL